MANIETSEFLAAIKQICAERDLPENRVFEVVEAALAAAYRKEYLSGEAKVEAELDPQTLKPKFYQVFEVVEDGEVKLPEKQIALSEAKKIKKKIKVGEEIKKPLPYKTKFGRIAAQTAKQVIIQKIREVEKEEAFNEYKDKVGKVVYGVVQQIEGKNVLVDLGKAIALLPPKEQNPTEEYVPGKKMKVLIVSVEMTQKGPSIIVSRASEALVESLFRTEVPEIESGVVKIKGIVREAGFRTKMAVATNEEGVDPVGSCVGQRGTRVQTVLNEIGGEEKIDIILWDKDPKKYIVNALSPAKVKEIEINEKKKHAEVLVEPDQLSLAIGKQGRNVRLASKLTGYEIDVFALQDGKKVKEEVKKKEDSKEESEKPKETKEKKASEDKTSAEEKNPKRTEVAGKGTKQKVDTQSRDRLILRISSLS